MRYFACAAAAFCAAIAAPAAADVLEIADDGAAVWIAGGQSSQTPQADPLSQSTSLSAPFPSDLNVPSEAVAIPAEHVRGIPQQYAAKVHELAARFDLSPSLIEALVWQESRWREGARSPVGARGLAQLMPATARELGVNPDDPMQNLEGGARYLRQQLDRFDGDLEKALAAYNAGPGRVIRAGGIPRIRETQKYVAAIMARLSNHSRTPNHSRVQAAKPAAPSN
ncbi:MAG: lytic transglycosylase domain-containing protein [Marinomonas sp.]